MKRSGLSIEGAGDHCSWKSRTRVADPKEIGGNTRENKIICSVRFIYYITNGNFGYNRILHFLFNNTVLTV